MQLPDEPPEPRIIGQSPAIQQLLRLIERVAPTDQALLISGPTGSGKEVLAQLIHRRSRRPSAPFIDLNCSAIPEHLVEAELFGHVRGAFTGAQSDRLGHLEMVGEGTLFLDEVGEMPMAVQPKLLRVLETRTFRPVGSSEIRHFKGRIIAATHRDLPAQIREGVFREDLYYRLGVFILDLPGLEQRREDIPELVEHFAALHARPLKFDAGAMAYLQQQPWPGNVRELRNLIDRLAVLADSPYISEEVLKAFVPVAPVVSNLSLDSIADRLLALPGEDKLALVEQLLIDRALFHTQGNKAAAARLLGIGRKAVERRLQSHEKRQLTAQQCFKEGRELLENSQFQKAISMLERGLGLVPTAPSDEEQLRLRYELYRLLGICYQSLEGWMSTDATTYHELAMGLARQLGDDVELTALLFWSWTAQLMALDLRKARGTAQEILQRAQASKSNSLINEAYIAQINTLFWLGDCEEALNTLHRSNLMEDIWAEYASPHGLDLFGLGLTFDGLASFQLGAFQQARQAMERLQNRSLALDIQPFHRAVALQGAAWLACLFEDPVRTGELSRELEVLSQQHGFSFYQGVGQVLRGYHLMRLYAYAEAEAVMIQGYEQHMLRSGGKLFHSFYVWKRGEVLLQAGRLQDCESLVNHGVDLAIEHQERAYLSELLTLKARICMAMGDFEGAEQEFRSAIATASALNILPARLQATGHLARLLIQNQRTPEAMRLLGKALQNVDSEHFPPSLNEVLLLFKSLSTSH